MSSGERAVAITGLGVVSGPDCGVEALRATLAGATMPTTRIDDRQGYHGSAAPRLAVLTGGLDLSRWVPPALGRRMSPPSRLAVAAARMALEMAGLSGAVEGAGTGVVMSSSFGPVTSTEQMLATARAHGPQAVSPFAFAESVANAAAGQIAIDARARGPNLTVVQREAGSLTAVGRAAALVASGRVDRALAGNVDEMPPILHALLGRFDALARPDATGREVARPFDLARSGFVAGEGAAVAVLEDEARARARGARVLSRVRGFGGAFDPTAPRIGWGRGAAGLAGALRRTLDAAGLAPADVDRVVSGASGARAGDRLEAEILRAAWGDRTLPPVLAPKGHVGQYGGGFLAAALLAMQGGTFGPTPGFDTEDPTLMGVRPFAGGALDAARLGLVLTAGSGGSAAWLLFEAQ